MDAIAQHPHLKVRNLVHRYRGRNEATLQDIDLDVRRGEILVVLGLSGSGKSTLLHIIAGHRRPTNGDIFVGGVRHTEPSRRCILLLQQPSLLPWMTVRQNISLGPKYAKRRATNDRDVNRLLELVGLGELGEANAQQLSGGQQQRAALARAIAAEPEILLLDEPFASLDPFTKDRLHREVHDIARAMGLTVVLVTHDIDEALRLGDRIVILGTESRRIEGEMVVALGDERDRASEPYRRERDALIRLYEKSLKRPPDRRDGESAAVSAPNGFSDRTATELEAIR